MKNPTGKLLIIYGAFLVVCGLAGYLSNPSRAISALISGGSAGATMMALGAAIDRNPRVISHAATGLIAVLTLVFGWRMVNAWQAATGDAPEKTFTAVLLTVMTLGSILAVIFIFRQRPAPKVAA
ncbi:MAG: hypothetical protein IAF08_15010 [Rhizobacter sp.]|nr:hypothetical protein [Chlorobiales bacterium]